MPSMITSGEPMPRMSNELLNVPGSELFCHTRRPATRPASMFCGFSFLVWIISEPFTPATAPVTEPRFCTPYPTTTTSSIEVLSSSMTTLMMLRLPISISWVFRPRNANSRVPSAGAVIV